MAVHGAQNFFAQKMLAPFPDLEKIGAPINQLEAFTQAATPYKDATLSMKQQRFPDHQNSPACTRCQYKKETEYSAFKSQKKRRFSLIEVIGAPIFSDIVGYACDVSMKSLLREMSEFYRLRFREFVENNPGMAVQ